MQKEDMAQRMKEKETRKDGLVIIRHGSTHLNSEDRIRGWSNLPLDDKGKHEALLCAKKLKKEKLDCLVTSDLKRTIETARIIARHLDIPIYEKSQDFRPWHVGDHTGQPSDEVMPILENYVRNKPNVKVQGGESFNTFKERFLSAVERVHREYPDERVGIVTHHRGDRIMAAWEKEGMKPNHRIDIDAFLEMGIPPGDYRCLGEKLTGPKER